jgi:hypothetical protein
MHVKSRVGLKRQHDHFLVAETPTHEILVESRIGEACDVIVQLVSKSKYVLIDGRREWTSAKMTHGGLRSRDTHKWPYRATLSFTQADPGRPQVIAIKVFMAAAWWPEDEPLPKIGELKHTIWVD